MNNSCELVAVGELAGKLLRLELDISVLSLRTFAEQLAQEEQILQDSLKTPANSGAAAGNAAPWSLQRAPALEILLTLQVLFLTGKMLDFPFFRLLALYKIWFEKLQQPAYAVKKQDVIKRIDPVNVLEPHEVPVVCQKMMKLVAANTRTAVARRKLRADVEVLGKFLAAEYGDTPLLDTTSFVKEVEQRIAKAPDNRLFRYGGIFREDMLKSIHERAQVRLKKRNRLLFFSFALQPEEEDKPEEVILRFARTLAEFLNIPSTGKPERVLSRANHAIKRLAKQQHRKVVVVFGPHETMLQSACWRAGIGAELISLCKEFLPDAVLFTSAAETSADLDEEPDAPGLDREQQMSALFADQAMDATPMYWLEGRG